jgi:hypothetical protein
MAKPLTRAAEKQPEHNNGHKPGPIVLPERADKFTGATETIPDAFDPRNDSFSRIMMRRASGGSVMDLPGHRTGRELKETTMLQMQQCCGNFNARQLLSPQPKVSNHEGTSFPAAGLGTANIIQLSPLSDELELVWNTEGKGSFFGRLRNLNVSDQDVSDFIERTLTGDDLWLARNILAYGPEANWPLPLQVERELKGWSGRINSSQVLTLLEQANDAEFEVVISAMTQDQTRELIANLTPADQLIHYALLNRITAARVVATGESMRGELRWRGGSGPEPSEGYQVRETTRWGHPNDFARWIRGSGPEPTSTSTMNCWEGVLFIAYQAGVVQKSWLEQIHQAAAAAGSAASSVDAYYTALESRLYSGSRSVFTYDTTTGIGSPDVPAGNIVFMNGIDHVMLSKGTTDATGRHEVISLWVFPSHNPPGPITTGSFGTIQDTTIEEVMVTGGMTGATVEFAPPPW